MLTNDLYRQFLQHRASLNRKQSMSSATQRVQNDRKAEIVRRLNDSHDESVVNLEQSVLFMRQTGIILMLRNTQHINEIMQSLHSKRKLRQDNRLLVTQCRFVYFLWVVIDQQEIELSQLIEMLLLLAQQNKGGVYGDEDTQATSPFDELIAAWRQMMCPVQETQCKDDWQQQISMIKARVNLSRQADEEIDKENNPIFGNTGQIKPYNNVSKCQRKKTPSLSVSRNNCSKQGVSVELGRYVSHNPDDIMSPQQETQLVNRLYRLNMYKQRQEMKQKLQREKLSKELEECTFKPCTGSRAKSVSKPAAKDRCIKGYQKAVQRMKLGQEKAKMIKQSTQYRAGPPITKQFSKTLVSVAPKFHVPIRDPDDYLFELIYYIGKHQIKLKIKATDSIWAIADKICKIYSLKPSEKTSIIDILEKELSRYYQEMHRNAQCAL